VGDINNVGTNLRPNLRQLAPTITHVRRSGKSHRPERSLKDIEFRAEPDGPSKQTGCISGDDSGHIGGGLHEMGFPSRSENRHFSFAVQSVVGQCF
jgi:hypothetical protein